MTDTKLDAIIDRHSSKLAGEFRPFNDTDWSGYAGCETESPEIWETEEFDVVLDGATIGVHVHQSTEDGQYVAWLYTAPTTMLARAVGEMVAQLELTGADLESGLTELFGESVC